mmetsp:Transcript_5582/g.8570  ORF Transcript_5582/g.8570 Transcript_5582/m.8570 type:complete len:87 (+) Transcript_5582:167-427(+)
MTSEIWSGINSWKYLLENPMYRYQSVPVLSLERRPLPLPDVLTGERKQDNSGKHQYSNVETVSRKATMLFCYGFKTYIASMRQLQR